ncbi:MAG: trypsin-like peptidase domain-containing protein [Rhodocyclaceae bacterium]|nr:trypsin-like peptidase domain-containing protein [Rhodocyclaceae bacterium]
MSSEAAFARRGSKEAMIYATYSPAVVLVLNSRGASGSGILITNSYILTNWHVVRWESYVSVFFKPKLEGNNPSRADLIPARVVKIDQVSDLALLELPKPVGNVKPIELGTLSEIRVGSDVHAIGHPLGQSWTYTKGIVSQMRRGYTWTSTIGIQHQADVIQTQTPINPGNSGGPLLSDAGRLVGVNSFKSEGEGVNFAVSADDVRRFLYVNTENRYAATVPAAPAPCTVRFGVRTWSPAVPGYLTLVDFDCDGIADGNYAEPSNPSAPITLSYFRNQIMVALFFDSNRDGRWDYSYHYITGRVLPDLIGYHDDGTLRVSRFAYNPALPR